jgi:phosphohistidine phosphatase
LELILWRHAEAEPGEIDQLRPLTPRGSRHASRIGAWLDRQLPAQCRILSSPATRCVQTVEALGRKFATVDALNTDSTPEAVIEASGWPEARLPVIIVGHQPLLGQVAALIFSGEAHAWKIRKGSVFWIANKGDAEGEPFVRLAAGPDMIGKLR